MVYFAYGWPCILNTGCSNPTDTQAVYLATAADLLIVVHPTTIQVWSTGQHRLKLGQLVRDDQSILEHGLNTMACWCPSRRILAVATDKNMVHLYGVRTTKDVIWPLKGVVSSSTSAAAVSSSSSSASGSASSIELKSMCIYLQNDLEFPTTPTGPEHQQQNTQPTPPSSSSSSVVAALQGDHKSLLVAFTDGTIRIFSWHGHMRSEINPFVALELEKQKLSRHRRRTSSTTHIGIGGDAGSNLNPATTTTASIGTGNTPLMHQHHYLAPPPKRTSSSSLSTTTTAHLLLPHSSIKVTSMTYSPAACLLVLILQDGRCALCTTSSGMGAPSTPDTSTRFLMWLYNPSNPSSSSSSQGENATTATALAVTAAIHAESNYLALGFSHGRVALYHLNALRSTSSSSSLVAPLQSASSLSRLQKRRTTSASSMSSSPPAAAGSSSPLLHPHTHPTTTTTTTASQGVVVEVLPVPARILSVVEWGYSSAVVGSASSLQWSPDGKVLAVGYSKRGVAVWTPSGCRVMSSLRQTAEAAITSITTTVGRGDGGGSGSGGTSTIITNDDDMGVGSPSALNPSHGSPSLAGPLEQSITALCWGPHGYQLYISETSSLDLNSSDSTDSTDGSVLYEVSFGKLPQQGQQHHAVFGGACSSTTQQQNQGIDVDAEDSTKVSMFNNNSNGSSDEGLEVLVAADRLLLVSQVPVDSTNPALHSVHDISDTIPSFFDGRMNNNHTNTYSSSDRTNMDNNNNTSGMFDHQAQGGGLTLQHIRAPQHYIASNYPLLHASIDWEKQEIAVAGSRGLAVYSLVTRQWKLIGDASQEKKIRVHHLRWLPGGVIVAAAMVEGNLGGKSGGHGGGGGMDNVQPLPSDIIIDEDGKHIFSPSSNNNSNHDGNKKRQTMTTTTTLQSSSSGDAAVPQLLLYPKHHLDESSLMARHNLRTIPSAIDVVNGYIMLAFGNLEVQLLQVVHIKQQHHQQQQVVALVPLKELSVMGVYSAPVKEIALIMPDKSTTTTTTTTSSGGGGYEREDGGRYNTTSTTTTAAAPANLLSVSTHPQQQPLDPDELPPSPFASTQLPPSATTDALSLSSSMPLKHLRIKVPLSPLKIRETPSGQPCQCLVLRSGGILTVLDLDRGSERIMANEIERFWLPHPPIYNNKNKRSSNSNTAAAPFSSSSSSVASSSASLHRANSTSSNSLYSSSTNAPLHTTTTTTTNTNKQLSIEMPWWTYGPLGTQLWFPSALSAPLTPTLSASSPASSLSHMFGMMAAVSHNGTGGTTSGGGFNSTSIDPELEFDKEVYPIALSPGEVAIIGVTQRTVRHQAMAMVRCSSKVRTSSSEAKNIFSSSSEQQQQQQQQVLPSSISKADAPLPGFVPLPESQLVLPCLLRRLLQSGQFTDAQALAKWYSTGPHFSQSLEWLLFTCLELDADLPVVVVPPSSSSQSGGGGGRKFSSSYAANVSALEEEEEDRDRESSGLMKTRAGYSGNNTRKKTEAGPLLRSASKLIKSFSTSLFSQIAVSVARKVDAELWPLLFSAVGPPSLLGNWLLSNGHLQQAACCLLIVDRIEGSIAGQGLALRTLKAVLARNNNFEMAVDLIRFLAPPEEGGGTAGGGGMGSSNNNNSSQNDGWSTWLWSYFSGQDKAYQKVDDDNDNDDTTTISTTTTTNTGERGTKKKKKKNTKAMSAKAALEAGAIGAPPGWLGPSGGAAYKAWQLMGHHAWTLLDSGALKSLAYMSKAMTNLQGGLPSALACVAVEVPMAASHLEDVSAASIASSLFVASNEFANLDRDMDFNKNSNNSSRGLREAAEALMEACELAELVNLHVAMALLLGEEEVTEQFAEERPGEWQELVDLISNDVHLCTFSQTVSPMQSPHVVRTGVF